MLEQLLALDTTIFYMINGLSHPVLDQLLPLVTELGSSYFMLILALLLVMRKDKKAGFTMLFALGINLVLLTVLKFWILRPRPFEVMDVNLLGTETDPSFPSGHSANAFLGGTILARHVKGIYWAFYILAIIISISRVYIGVHYPIDILFGAVQGILIALFVLQLPIKKYMKKLGLA